MKIYTIIVTYNATKWLDKCFSSLLASNLPTEIIVVDNLSTDDTLEQIRLKYPQAYVIEMKENAGFARANNIGFKHALRSEADYVFLLNQDAWIEVDTLDKLIKSFHKKKNIGIVSPIHMNGAGIALDKNFSIYMSSSFISDAYLGKLQPEYFVDYVNAAAWMINSQCLKKVGGFDTLLFTHYGEDNNYCQRLKYHKFKILINTQSIIYHDREKRGNEKDYRGAIWGKTHAHLGDKIALANINKDVNIDRLIATHKRSYKKNLLLCRHKRLKNLKIRITLYEQIKKSRYINTIGGCVWI